MQLSLEMFNQIVSHLKGGRDGLNNKRREPRVGMRNRVNLTPLKGMTNRPDRPARVAVRDLSRDGIGFLLTRRIPLKSMFSIELPALDEGAMTATYRVTHCEPLEEGLYRIGGTLINVCEAPASLVPVAAASPAAAPAARRGATAAARRARSADAA